MTLQTIRPGGMSQTAKGRTCHTEVGDGKMLERLRAAGVSGAAEQRHAQETRVMTQHSRQSLHLHCLHTNTGLDTHRLFLVEFSSHLKGVLDHACSRPARICTENICATSDFSGKAG